MEINADKVLINRCEVQTIEDATECVNKNLDRLIAIARGE